MFSSVKPSHAALKEFLWQLRDAPFTYSEVEGTRNASMPGYTCATQRVQLGVGREIYLRAKQSLREWKMFPASFVELIWPVPIEPGNVVATLFRAPGFWTLNPCRIVYTVDDVELHDGESIERFGFAYGTVGRHLACGEERFSVEYHHVDQSVWYEVYCFSRASHWLAKLAYPYLRLQQFRFRHLSGLAMQRSVASPSVARI